MTFIALAKEKEPLVACDAPKFAQIMSVVLTASLTSCLGDPHRKKDWQQVLRRFPHLLSAHGGSLQNSEVHRQLPPLHLKNSPYLQVTELNGRSKDSEETTVCLHPYFHIFSY